jgi:hypothetical protein
LVETPFYPVQIVFYGRDVVFHISVVTNNYFQISVLKKTVYTRFVILASRPDISSVVLQANNMVALHDFAAMVQRHCFFVLLVLVATNSRIISAQNISTVVESRETKTSVWWPVVQCVLFDDVNKCLQDRSLRAFVGLGTASQ